MTVAPSARRAIVSASAASAATAPTPAGPEPRRLTTLTRRPSSASSPATLLPMTPAPMTRTDSPMRNLRVLLALSLESSALALWYTLIDLTQEQCSRFLSPISFMCNDPGMGDSNDQASDDRQLPSVPRTARERART